MIPISLSITGFLSYRDPVEIDFTTFDLACIAGRNGAGKSALLDAITWALFGQARQRGEAIINNQSDLAEVSLVFQYERNVYRVQRANPRGDTSVLEFQIAINQGSGIRDQGSGIRDQGSGIRDQESGNGEQGSGNGEQVAGNGERSTSKDAAGINNWSLNTITWKPLTERTMRDTQARIEETLRLDYETFVNAAFFLQGKADQFTQQRPGDRKRILANILGLEIWETYRKRTVDGRKTIESEINTLDGRLSEIHTELSEERARKKRLQELESDLERLAETKTAQADALEQIKKTIALLDEQRKMAASLAQRLDALKKRMSELELRLGARENEQKSYSQQIARADEIEAAYAQWQQLRDELSRWDEIAEQFREQEKRRRNPLTTIEADRARLTQELENLEERESGIRKQETGIGERKSQISNISSRISVLESRLAERKSLETELDSGRERLANAKAENPRLKAEMDELKARIDQLARADDDVSVCPLCEQSLSPDERKRLVDELNTDGTEMGDKYRANRKLLAEADELVTQLQSRIADLESVDDEVRERRRKYDQLAAQSKQIEALQAEWKVNGAPRMAEIEQALADENFAAEARTELAQIDAELKKIGYDAATHDDVRRAEVEGRAADDVHRSLGQAKAALDPLEREIESLNDEVSSLREQIQNLGADHTAATSALAAAEESAPDLRQAQRDLLDLQENENRLRMEVGAARQKVLVLGDLKQRRKSLDSERESLAKKAGQYKQLEKAFGKDGVPALLIEQALPQIEARTNEILDRLSGGDMSVRFETQRELKTRDALKETLDIQISDSAGARDYEMYSGGEAFRINFAIRLALSEMLAQRAGARLQTLIIDEGFGSQDEVGRQRLIEAINLIKSDFAKILVITHIDSLKDVFPTRIEVVKTERGSVVRVV
ncbi:MAG: SMC family ATPase [Chloroflexota bacterium]|nr:SMC family ATPase [Chloroflexota bacterium]